MGKFACTSSWESYFLNRLLKGSCQPPKAAPCIIHVHLHNLLSPYHGLITAAPRMMTEPEHTVLKYSSVVQCERNKPPERFETFLLDVCVCTFADNVDDCQSHQVCFHSSSESSVPYKVFLTAGVLIQHVTCHISCHFCTAKQHQQTD